MGRPLPSVIVEAYRHLVEDDLDGMPPSAVGPRRLLTCSVDVERILDLRDSRVLASLGLDPEALASEVGAYGPCHRVALAAHQLDLWGVIAPAATGLGETLALFELHVPADRWPTLTASEIWQQLPSDPRRLHLAHESSAG